MKESTMRPTLKPFITQYVVVIAAALIPVAITAFLGIPFNLGGPPGVVRTNVPAATNSS
jgi:hypothetical protein